ncbi:hypothetical protein [Streptomyces sp. NPDC055400]
MLLHEVASARRDFTKESLEGARARTGDLPSLSRLVPAASSTQALLESLALRTLTGPAHHLAARTTALPAVSRDDRNTIPAQRRRHRILALLQDGPTRLWRVAEIAARFGDIRLDSMYRQLSRWADSGLIHKIGPGLYAATTWTPTALQPAEMR